MNNSGIALALQAGTTFTYVMPFSTHKLLLDGTENTIVLTPQSAPPAPGTIAGEFLTSGDIANGLLNVDSGSLYIPPVRLPLVTVATATQFDTPVTYGPFYVGDYEQIVFACETFRNNNPVSPPAGGGADCVLRFTWFDAPVNGNAVSSTIYKPGFNSDNVSSIIRDKLNNVGPYVTVTITRGTQSIGSKVWHTLSLVAARTVGIGDISIVNPQPFFLVDTSIPTTGTFTTPKLQLVSYIPVTLTWSTQAATDFSIDIHAVDSNGLDTRVLTVTQATGLGGSIAGVIPGQIAYLQVINPSAATMGVTVAVLPLSR